MRRGALFLLGLAAIVAAFVVPGLAQASPSDSDRAVASVQAALASDGAVASLSAASATGSNSAQAVAAIGLLSLGIASVAVSSRRRRPQPAAANPAGGAA